METRAGSAAGSTHCSGNLPLSALPAPAPPEPLSASARPFPARGAGAGRAWGWVRGTAEEGAKKTSPCASGGVCRGADEEP